VPAAVPRQKAISSTIFKVVGNKNRVKNRRIKRRNEGDVGSSVRAARKYYPRPNHGTENRQKGEGLTCFLTTPVDPMQSYF